MYHHRSLRAALLLAVRRPPPPPKTALTAAGAASRRQHQQRQLRLRRISGRPVPPSLGGGQIGEGSFSFRGSTAVHHSSVASTTVIPTIIGGGSGAAADGSGSGSDFRCRRFLSTAAAAPEAATATTASTTTSPSSSKVADGDEKKTKRKKKEKGPSSSISERRRRQGALRRWQRARQKQQQQLKKKRRERERRMEGAGVVDLRRRSEEDFGRLLDRIMPKYSITKLRDVVRKIKTTIRKNKGGKGGTDLPLVTILLATLHSTSPNDGSQVSILEFMLGTDRRTKIKKKKPPAASAHRKISERGQKEGGNSDGIDEEEEEMERAVAVLMRARERSLGDEVFCWDDRKRQKKKKKKKKHVAAAATSKETDEFEAEQLAEFLRDNLPVKHFHSILSLFEAYVGGKDGVSLTEKEGKEGGEEGDEGGDDLSGYKDGVDASPESGLDDPSTSNKTSSNEHKHPKRRRYYSIRQLGTHLKKRAGTHYALFAQQVADFFYFDRQLEQDDQRFVATKAKWDSYKKELVASLTEIQDKIWEEVVEASSDDPYMPSSSDTGSDDIISSDSELTSADGDVADQESVLSAVESQLDLSSIVQRVPEGRRDRRYKRPAHISLDATVLHEEVAFYDTEASAAETGLNGFQNNDGKLLPSQTAVFLDNLPIDITEPEIMELYSRCGDINSIQIFNQRPDLDPGPLTPAQLASRRKKQMQSVAVSFNRRWHRPKTPVYALVNFKGLDGYRACTIDELRIFGMIIRRHAVRTRQATDMTKLFIENFPEGIPCLDFQYMLNQHLIHDLFISLGAWQNNRAVAGSCEIQFPSFEHAYASYDKLLDLDLVKDHAECKVNWLRTRKDAEKWWTREKGFD